MEKNFRNITNLSETNQADRIQQIERKLKFIVEEKAKKAKEEKSNNSTLRVLTIEKKSHELILKFESESTFLLNEVREQKENLKTLIKEHEESTSKQQLSLRNRMIEIEELQGKAANLLKIELERTKECEKKSITQYEEKIETMRLAIIREIESRKEYFLGLDQTLCQQLPSIQAEIANRMSESSNKLDQIENDIQTETQKICKEIEESQSRQLGSFEEFMKMMSSVIAEIKEEINIEKEGRKNNKKKLMNLFEGAYTKLSV